MNAAVTVGIVVKSTEPTKGKPIQWDVSVDGQEMNWGVVAADGRGALEIARMEVNRRLGAAV